MTKVKIPYYVIKNGNGFWQPTKRMRAMGFLARTCGPDGPEAWAHAWRYNQDWQDCRQGRSSPPKHLYPPGSCGEAWERLRRSSMWTDKAPATRDEWDYVWRFIGPVFGDVAPQTVEMEMVAELRSIVREQVSPHAAHRVLKVWRALWKIMAAMQLCDRHRDPSLAIRNSAPKGRSEEWREGEVVHLVKTAWRRGYYGLAAIIAVAWDTQFSPGDVRTLVGSQRVKDAMGTYFDQSRGKTGKDAIGTLSRRTEALLEHYLTTIPFDILKDAQIFRNRSGKPYTKDKLGVDFRAIRNAAFPGDKRQLIDMRRSGAIEATAGGATAESLSSKMANSLAQSKRLQDTYTPKRAATVRITDVARIKGRNVLRENG